MSQKSVISSDNGSERVSSRADGDDELEFADTETAATFAGRLNHFLRKQGKAFVRNFIDYGPPYAEKPFDVALINECAKPVLNHMELHKMLNTRLDPNLPDPEDLYYTPIHWCARNAHYLGLKMLRRAGAKVNVTNEMGVTPLDLVVMMKHPPDRRREQVKCVRYLLECGAEVNTRDKGGYGPIDHAAVNQDLEVILMLLERGARVMRENYIFVGSRHHILRNVHDPECYKVLYETLLKEEDEAFAKQIKLQQRNFVIDEEKKHEKLHLALNKKKQRRLERLKLLEDNKRNEEVLQERLEKLKAEMEKNLKAQERSKADHGRWTKDFAGHWEFFPRRCAPVTSSGIYEANKQIMTQLQHKNSIDRFNNVWRQVTDKGRIELPWKKSDPFSLAGENMKQIDSTKVLLTTKSLQSLSTDVEYRDENDQELEGENLDDILNDLQSI
jgi:ankyrin repeat protein